MIEKNQNKNEEKKIKRKESQGLMKELKQEENVNNKEKMKKKIKRKGKTKDKENQKENLNQKEKEQNKPISDEDDFLVDSEWIQSDIFVNVNENEKDRNIEGLERKEEIGQATNTQLRYNPIMDEYENEQEYEAEIALQKEKLQKCIDNLCSISETLLQDNKDCYNIILSSQSSSLAPYGSINNNNPSSPSNQHSIQQQLTSPSYSSSSSSSSSLITQFPQNSLFQQTQSLQIQQSPQRQQSLSVINSPQIFHNSSSQQQFSSTSSLISQQQQQTFIYPNPFIASIMQYLRDTNVNQIKRVHIGALHQIAFHGSDSHRRILADNGAIQIFIKLLDSNQDEIIGPSVSNILSILREGAQRTPATATHPYWEAIETSNGLKKLWNVYTSNKPNNTIQNSNQNNQQQNMNKQNNNNNNNEYAWKRAVLCVGRLFRSLAVPKRYKECIQVVKELTLDHNDWMANAAIITVGNLAVSQENHEEILKDDFISKVIELLKHRSEELVGNAVHILFQFADRGTQETRELV